MFEIRVVIRSCAGPAVELMRCVFINQGIAAETIVEERTAAGSRLSVYSDDRKTAVNLAGRLKVLKLHNARVGVRVVKDENWRDRWKKYFRPFFIAPGIRIVPAWKKTRIVPARDVLIDTTFAFGTGMHATTAMMARFIRAAAGAGKSFLDVGTGSGILAVIAARSGFTFICAIDNDASAVATARENFAANGVEPACLQAVPFEDFETAAGQYDFVAANLLTEDLTRMRRKLLRSVSPGGLLAVSGIYKDNYTAFRRRFKDAGLSCVRACRRGGWHAVLFRKRIRQ